jgi:serine phosphatase RsbU (regulator of sigma subunit)
MSFRNIFRIKSIIIFEILLILIPFFILKAQNQEIDNLRLSIQKVGEDTTTIKNFLNFSEAILPYHPDSAFLFAQKGLILSKKLSSNTFICLSQIAIGKYYLNTSNYDSAFYYFNNANQNYVSVNNSKGIALSEHYLGKSKQGQGKFTEALEYYLKALPILDQSKDYQLLALLLLDIGEIYSFIGNPDKASENVLRALEIMTNHKNNAGIAATQIAYGNILSDKKDYEQALNRYLLAVRLLEELKDKKGIGLALHSIGTMHAKESRHRVAIEYFLKSIEFKKEFNDQYGIALSYADASESYAQMAKFKEGIEIGKKAIELAEKIGAFEIVQRSSKTLYQCYKLTGDMYRAMEANERYITLKDSLFGINKTKEFAKLQTNHEIVQKQKEIELLEKDNKLQEETIAIHSLQRNILIGGVLMAGLAIWIVFRSMQQTKKANNLLIIKNLEIEQQKEEILTQAETLKELNNNLSQTNEELNTTITLVNQQKDEIERKNINITSSLNYASRIQKAILPKSEEMNELFPQHMVLYKPRDIVSGDFYWVIQTSSRPIYEEKMTFEGSVKVFKGVDSGKVIFAVADCTGHGVPGAFMSMIGHDMLNQIVIEKNIYSPELILSELHKSIRSALKQDKNEIRDGMDIAIISYDASNKMVEYAGAMNPIFYVQNGEIKEIKADKKPIGGFQLQDEQTFTKHSIDISVPTWLYIASDGFQDQFGGKDRRKFLTKNFRNLLLEIHQNPMNEQSIILDKVIMDWMKEGNEHQIDDITVVGIKF